MITTGLNLTINDNNTSFESSSVGLIEKDEMMLPLTENITNLQEKKSNVSQEFRVQLSITEFRKDPMYSINFNWFRFISIGVVPFLLLAYFNTQIYLGKILFVWILDLHMLSYFTWENNDKGLTTNALSFYGFKMI